MSEQNVDAAARLARELAQVEQAVQAALQDLRPPFSQLVQGQLRTGVPPLRSAFVLTAGVAAVDSPALVLARCNLGAAIEVLRLALAVHTRLLSAGAAPAPIDRSLLGSTVLAGDFCFSRSAELAAKTDSPVVVDIFAQALQRVSEGTLRSLFDAGAAPFDVERELCLSGVAAANQLAGLAEAERQADRAAALLLLDAWQAGAAAPATLPPSSLAAWSPARAAAWQALQAWLAAMRTVSPPA